MVIDELLDAGFNLGILLFGPGFYAVKLVPDDDPSFEHNGDMMADQGRYGVRENGRVPGHVALKTVTFEDACRSTSPLLEWLTEAKRNGELVEDPTAEPFQWLEETRLPPRLVPEDAILIPKPTWVELIEGWIRGSGGSPTACAWKLGVSRSTLARWRKGARPARWRLERMKCGSYLETEDPRVCRRDFALEAGLVLSNVDRYDVNGEILMAVDVGEERPFVIGRTFREGE